MSAPTTSPPAVLSEPLRLPCGAELPNRIAKAAMTEPLASIDGAVSERLIGLYRTWAAGGAGLIITGNAMIDGRALEAARNTVIEDRSDLEGLRRLAASTRDTDAKLIVQLSHPGRQTMRGLSRPGEPHEVVGPSPIKVDNGIPLLFEQPRELAAPEIREIIERFARGAEIVEEAGFDGVQVHAAHGYLLSAFLSPLANRREDEWGGSPENRARLLLEVVSAVRERTGDGFIVSVKLNSADFQRGGFGPEDAIAVAKQLEELGVDLLEISGGSYESTAMMGTDGGGQADSPAPAKRESTREREAYFLEFAKRFAAELELPLMLTGGFRTAAAMADAVASGAVDVVGLGRPLATEFDLAGRILEGSAEGSAARPHAVGVRAFDDALDLLWHTQQLSRVGRGKPPHDRGDWTALLIGLAVQQRDGLHTRLPKRN